MPLSYEITTARLRLFAPTLSELRALLRNERKALGARINATIPPEWPGPDLYAALPQIMKEMVQEPGDARWVWMIIEPNSAQVIGDVGFHGALHAGATAEVGYVLLPKAHGNGYATEAASALIEWAFSNTAVERIIAQIDPANTASLRVAAKLGMRMLPPISAKYKCLGISRPELSDTQAFL